jgi:hypothetical protein
MPLANKPRRNLQWACRSTGFDVLMSHELSWISGSLPDDRDDAIRRNKLHVISRVTRDRDTDY